MTPSVAIGVGCRLGCRVEVIERLVHQALASAPGAAPAGLFTIADKRGEVGLTQAAERLGLNLTYLPRSALLDKAPSVQTRSPRAESRFGVPSVAEAAALAGAGPGSLLIVPRIANGGATCAIAGFRDVPA
jgi:cobalt-precorrin 5A hydrolase